MSLYRQELRLSNSGGIPINSLLNPSDEGGQEGPRPQRLSPGSLCLPESRYQPSFTDRDSGYGGDCLSQEAKSPRRASIPHREDDVDDGYDALTPESSGSSTVYDRRRPPRPKYDEEEMYFIWYHRVDLDEEWKDVQESFNRQFPGRQRNGFQGIQCKFYRFIKDKQCPSVRSQRHHLRDGDYGRNHDLSKFGVIQFAGVWYPWMRPEHAKFLNSPQSISSAGNRTPGYSDTSFSTEERYSHSPQQDNTR